MTMQEQTAPVQTTRLDEEPDLLKWAEETVCTMNQLAERLERARKPQQQANIAATIEDQRSLLSMKGILIEEDHDRYTLLKTEKQVLAIATMVRDLNLDYERRQIERMYEEIDRYLERARRLIADSVPEIREHKLGRLRGSNDLQYYGNKVQELVIQIETAEKIFKAMELPERNTRS